MSSEVPDGWRHGRISDLVLEVTVRIDPKAVADPDTPYIGLEDIGQGTGRFVSVGRASEATSQKSCFAAGDVLFGKLRPNLKKVARPDFDGICSTDIVVFRPRSQVDPEFAFRVLASDPVIERAVSQSAGTKMPRAHARSVLDFETTYPPFDEQKRIAEVLRSVDEAIRLSKATAEQSLRSLDATLETLMNGSGVDEDGWIEGRCDSFFVLQRGFDITENQATPGLYQVISSSGPSYTHDEAAVAAPVVITGRKGRLGTVFYAEYPCWPHDTTLWVKDFRGNNPRFVYWKLRAMKLETFDAATSVPTLNRNNVHALHIRFPSVRQQVEIAAILDTQERALLDQRAQACALEIVRARLASDLLSGRVRVPA